MLRLRPSQERGHANHGWLDTYHTFSFADYYDEEHHHFRSLRVINEDRVDADSGFPTHPHRDMEIVTYIISGALQHRDSMGNGSVIRPGMLQRMTAGTGVTHSEFNPSKTDPVHLLQIWIIPESRGLTPGYEEKTFGERLEGKLALVASRNGRDGSLIVHQDMSLYAGKLGGGHRESVSIAPERHAWVQLAGGSVKVRGTSGDSMELAAGDGLAVSGESGLELAAGKDGAHLLVFDLG